METPEDLTKLSDYGPDGVELTLIRWMLSQTRERLEYLEQRFNDIVSIRDLNAQA